MDPSTPESAIIENGRFWYSYTRYLEALHRTNELLQRSSSEDYTRRIGANFLVPTQSDSTVALSAGKSLVRAHKSGDTGLFTARLEHGGSMEDPRLSSKGDCRINLFQDGLSYLCVF